MSGGVTRESRRIRDVDSAARALRIKALVWAFIGSIPFLLLGPYVAAGTSSPRLISAVIVLSAFSIMYFGSLYLGEWLGCSAGSICFSGGGSSSDAPAGSRARREMADIRLAKQEEEQT